MATWIERQVKQAEADVAKYGKLVETARALYDELYARCKAASRDGHDDPVTRRICGKAAHIANEELQVVQGLLTEAVRERDALRRQAASETAILVYSDNRPVNIFR